MYFKEVRLADCSTERLKMRKCATTVAVDQFFRESAFFSSLTSLARQMFSGRHLVRMVERYPLYLLNFYSCSHSRSFPCCAHAIALSPWLDYMSCQGKRFLMVPRWSHFNTFFSSGGQFMNMRGNIGKQICLTLRLAAVSTVNIPFPRNCVHIEW